MKKASVGVGIVLTLVVMWAGWATYRYKSFNFKEVIPNATELVEMKHDRITGSILAQIMLVARAPDPENPTAYLQKTFAIASFNAMKSQWEIVYSDDHEGEMEYSVGELTPEKKRVVLVKEMNPGSAGGLDYKVIYYANNHFEVLLQGEGQAVDLKNNTVFEQVDAGLLNLYDWKGGKFIATATRSNYSAPRPLRTQVLNYSSETGRVEVDKEEVYLKVGESLYINRRGKGPDIDMMIMDGDCLDFGDPSSDNVKATKEGSCELQIMLAPKNWRTAKIVKVVVKKS